MSSTTPATKAKITWGLTSLIFKDTPQTATVVATVCLYAAAVLNAVFISFPQIPAPVKTVVGEYSVSVVAFVHLICNMFGITTVNPTTAATK